jgi:hypothetical protein
MNRGAQSIGDFSPEEKALPRKALGRRGSERWFSEKRRCKLEEDNANRLQPSLGRGVPAMRTLKTSMLGTLFRVSGIEALVLITLFLLQACAGGAATPGPTVSAPSAPESVWDALHQPRPDPLEGAVRVTVSEIVLLADPWGIQSPVPASLGIQELISAGLLRRQDVEFVERRRFSVAAELERRGQSRPRGAPPVGVSRGAELVLAGSWAPASADSAYLDFRLTRAETGEVVGTFRRSTPRDADPTALARSISSGLLGALGEMNRLPTWTDPFPAGAPAAFQPSGISNLAVASFFSGIAAEDRFDWEKARSAYQDALDVAGPSFREAEVALARIARLRAGGTLGSGYP